MAKDNGNNLSLFLTAAGMIAGLIIGVYTWSTSTFATKGEATQIYGQMLDIKADIREIKLDVKEISRVVKFP